MPFNKQPSNAHGDFEEPGGLLCLIISMQSSVAFPSGLGAVNLILLKLKVGSLGIFLFKPRKSLNPLTKPPSCWTTTYILLHILQ